MSEHTVERPTVKRLERSRSDRWLAGVSGGLARYFDMHPAFYRVGFVVLTLIGGAGIIIYLAAALVIPDEGREDSIAAEVLQQRGQRPWPLIGLGLVAVAGAILLARASFGDAGWVMLLVAGLAILWLTRREPQPVREAGETETQAFAAQDSRRVRRLGRAVAIVVGAFVALVVVAATVFAAVLPVHVGRGVGDYTYTVVETSALQERYTLGIGDLRLDLSDLQLPLGETHVSAQVDVGKLTVVVPPDAAVQIHGEAQFGEVMLLGEKTEGRDVSGSVSQAGSRILVLDGRVGAGQVVVERAVR